MKIGGKKPQKREKINVAHENIVNRSIVHIRGLSHTQTHITSVAATQCSIACWRDKFKRERERESAISKCELHDGEKDAKKRKPRTERQGKIQIAFIYGVVNLSHGCASDSIIYCRRRFSFSSSCDVLVDKMKRKWRIFAQQKDKNKKKTPNGTGLYGKEEWVAPPFGSLHTSNEFIRRLMANLYLFEPCMRSILKTVQFVSFRVTRILKYIHSVLHHDSSFTTVYTHKFIFFDSLNTVVIVNVVNYMKTKFEQYVWHNHHRHYCTTTPSPQSQWTNMWNVICFRLVWVDCWMWSRNCEHYTATTIHCNSFLQNAIRIIIAIPSSVACIEEMKHIRHEHRRLNAVIWKNQN